jgi:hypothetical protein
MIVTNGTPYEARDDEPTEESEDEDALPSSVDQAKELEQKMEESGEENAA